MVLGTRRKGHAAPAPDGGANGARAGPSSALLAPRLAAPATHFGTTLLGPAALAGAGEVGRHHLVHQVLIELPGKIAGRNLNRSRRPIAAGLGNTQFHG